MQTTALILGSESGGDIDKAHVQELQYKCRSCEIIQSIYRAACSDEKRILNLEG